MDCSLSYYSVQGDFHARILKWIAISTSMGSFQPRNQPCVPCITGRFFSNWAKPKNTLFYFYSISLKVKIFSWTSLWLLLTLGLSHHPFSCPLTILQWTRCMGLRLMIISFSLRHMYQNLITAFPWIWVLITYQIKEFRAKNIALGYIYWNLLFIENIFIKNKTEISQSYTDCQQFYLTGVLICAAITGFYRINAFKNDYFSSGGCKSKIRVITQSGSWWGPYSWLTASQLLAVSSHSRKKSKLYSLSLSRILIPSWKPYFLTSSKSSYLPYPLSPDNIPLRNRSQNMSFGRIHTYGSVQFSHSVVSDSLWSLELQYARPPCPSPSSRGPPKSMSTVSVIPSNHLILCLPLLLLPSIFPSIRVFSNESAVCIRWPKYWSFSFSISPSNEHPGMIYFRWTGWISSQSRGLSTVFSKSTVQKHQFFRAQLSL